MLKPFQKFFTLMIIVAWIFSGWPQLGSFPPEVLKVHADTTHGPYTFDSDGDSDEDAWTFVSDNGTNGLNAANTARAWSHDTNDTTSSNVGPTSGQGGSPDGYVYTEASSPGATDDTFHMTFDTVLDASSDTWEVDFYWNQRGDSNTATVKVQTNENSAGWVDRATYAASGPDVGTSGTQVWNNETLDLTGVISHSSTQVRLLVTFPSSGTIWNNDFGIDTITITGTTSNLSPAAPTLNDTPFDNKRTQDSTPSFEFTASDPDGSADIIYQIQIDDDNAFGSPLVNCESDTSCATGAGSFTNTVSGGDTNPFNEGEKISFTPTTVMTTGTTYYWRVRAEDVSGGYGSYSTIQSITYTSGTDPSEWFQTTDEQFSGDTLSGVGAASDAVSIGASITATGGTITESGGYNYHTFTSSGTFQVTAGSGDVEVVIVGGGAGGGTGGRGGGGAGGIVASSTYAVTTTSYTVTVGAGSAGAASSGVKSNNGGNSVFDTLTALGGGGSGQHATAGAAGGSGGGGNGYLGEAGGAANQPGSASGGFGSAGGASYNGGAAPGRQGGGGGVWLECSV